MTGPELPREPPAPVRADRRTALRAFLDSPRFPASLAIGAWCLPVGFAASFYGTWFTAWAVLGHAPRPSLDDPKSISPLLDLPYAVAAILLVGSPVWAFGGAAAVAWHAAERGKGCLPAALRVLLLFCAWAAAFAALWLHPTLGEWYMD